jgi:hypothetical protein
LKLFTRDGGLDGLGVFPEKFDVEHGARRKRKTGVWKRKKGGEVVAGGVGRRELRGG